MPDDQKLDYSSQPTKAQFQKHLKLHPLSKNDTAKELYDVLFDLFNQMSEIEKIHQTITQVRDTNLIADIFGRQTLDIPPLPFPCSPEDLYSAFYASNSLGAVGPLFEEYSKEDDEGEFREAYEQPISEVPKGGKVFPSCN